MLKNCNNFKDKLTSFNAVSAFTKIVT